MTLREQIKAIHLKHFGREFNNHRGSLVPAMVNDLKMKFFDDLVLHDFSSNRYGGVAYRFWTFPDSVDLRAVRKAGELIQTIGLRENTPGVE